MEFLRDRGPFAIFVAGFDGVHDDAYGRAAHGLEGLTNGGEGWCRKCGDGNVVKSGDGTLLWNADASLGEGAHGAKCSQIVKSKDGGEFFLLLQQLFGEAVAVFEAGVGIKDVGNLQNQAGFEIQFNGLSEFLNAPPTWRAVDQALGPTNDGDATMPPLVKMFEGKAASGFVVDHHGADPITGNFPTNRGGRNLLFVDVGEDVDIDEEPVGHNDQAIDVTLEKHLEITLKTVVLVVGIGEDGKVAEGIEGVFDPAQDGRAEWIGNIEEHYTNALAAAASEEAGHRVWTVSQAFGSLFNAQARAGGDIASEWSIVENDRNSSRRKPSGLSNVAHGDKPALEAGLFHW